jgi:hypothetical protein
MSSWFEVGDWLTGYLIRLRHPETKLAIQHAAKLLGAKVRIRGENALIFTAPYGLLFYIGGPDLQAYCCVYDRKRLDLKAAMRLRFHQYNEPMQANSWIWFSRMDKDGATAYKIEKIDRSYVWIINRVMPAVATRSEPMNRRDAVIALGVQIAGDFRAYQRRLVEIPM